MNKHVVRYLIICTVLLYVASATIASAVSLPDTGQTKCYDNTREISCPLPGQPFYGQDAQYGTNRQSFTDLGNGIVRDNVTGLEWQQATAPGDYTWNEAISYCEDLTLGGHSDWRLPTIKELSTLVDSSIPSPGPAINTAYFPDTRASIYFSSTIYASDSFSLWVVYFDRGRVFLSDKSVFDYVRAVRGEPFPANNFIDNGDGTVTDTSTGLMWQQETALGIYTWREALAYCENLTLAGYSDWRLPNRNELQSLVDYSLYKPAINTAYFPDTRPSQYWSSTTYASDPSTAWGVFYNYGQGVGFNKLDRYAVRAVRGGLCGDLGDADGDTVCDGADNCPTTYNPGQEDEDSNGVGDVCEGSSTTTTVPGEGCTVAVQPMFLPLTPGLLPQLRRIVLTGDGANWNRTSAVSIEDIPIVMPLRIQPAQIHAIIVIPSMLFGRFTPGEKAVSVVTGTALCTGTVNIP